METEIASLLAYNGFELEIIEETGIRGNDFDLAATKEGITFSIEVTAKEDGPLTVKTISNTLNNKRTQVPPDRPAVLYIRIPAEWMRDTSVAQPIFTEAFSEFCLKSSRFNAMVLVWEEVTPFLNGGLMQMHIWACYNHIPRHLHSEVYLMEPVEAPDGRKLLAHSFFDFLKSVQAKLSV